MFLRQRESEEQREREIREAPFELLELAMWVAIVPGFVLWLCSLLLGLLFSWAAAGFLLGCDIFSEANRRAAARRKERGE